jgi:DNA (cytosine-5)-methyltransferase 1
MKKATVLEICAGAGGQSLGLEEAGFEHAAAIDIDPYACQTLVGNRPGWRVIEADIARVRGHEFKNVDLIAGGIPCPPFSVAGKQLGELDERDLFPQTLRLVREADPPAVMIENVPGFANYKFDEYRERVLSEFRLMEYDPDWRVLNACDFGVSQLRPRFVLVALKRPYVSRFAWPSAKVYPPTVGERLADLMTAKGWPGAPSWIHQANDIAPTIVGGSRKHGGPDLGPTRARAQWRKLRVDGLGVADSPPSQDFPTNGHPRLTARMIARLQGFPDWWCFAGGKTSACRQIGNAFPPPVARAVGLAVRAALQGRV